MSAINVPPDAKRAQLAASDPDQSVWVAANAGSGKTYVLVRRVVRHLLAGTPPGAILCLTFTKAAAATMANRVFELLSKWVQMDDAALAAEVEAIEGVRPSAARLVAARRLFAEALETPGGLKIQTIHAFCERVLHLFPFEANVPSQFTILDERAAAEMMALARTDVLVAAAKDPSGGLGQALDHLSLLGADETVTELIDAALRERKQLAAMMALGDDQIRIDLCSILDCPSGDTAEAISREEIERALVPVSEWRSVAAEIRHLSQAATDQNAAQALERAATNALASAETYRRVFLTADDSPRKTILTKAVMQASPRLATMFMQEAIRLESLVARRRAVYLREGTLAILTIARAVLARVEAIKTQRGALDFDDLIARTFALFSRVSAQWVLYKLDQSIDHILVDEAQDTSPDQWAIIRVLVDEFTSGAGARGSKTRTIFVVGDEKQSIYSFQGADPRYFDEMRQHFARRFADSGGVFQRVPLKHSFRSTEQVLMLVDRVFTLDDARRGLSADNVPPVHEAARISAPGIVEIWPPTVGEPKPERSTWEPPVDSPRPGNAEHKLALRIASHIRIWLDRGETLPARDTPLRPGDILILVRSRGRLFNAIIRALKKRNIPVAGADRLVLNDHIAVQDLLALGDCLLTPQDDLALACVLKSPLFGLDDADLIAFAPERRGTLEAALRQARPDVASLLDRWRGEALRETPATFYTRLLARDGMRRAFLARLGSEANDALDEFIAMAMAFEQAEWASLAGFLHFMRSAETQVKRDMDHGRDEVRVMTVHGAKGLEAKLVFLADTMSPPGGQHDPKFFALKTPNSPPDAPEKLVWAPSKGSDVAATREAREQAQTLQEEEYRRLLYVALTRAEDKLVICGAAPMRESKKPHWMAMVEAEKTIPFETVAADDGDGEVRRYTTAPVRSVTPVQLAGPVRQPLPDWVSRPAPRLPPQMKPLVPSQAVDGQPRGFQESALAARRNALLRGTLTHRLLQSLPDVAEGLRENATRRFLAQQDGLEPGLADDIATAVLRLLREPDFAPLFAGGSRAEVSIAGQLHGLSVSGQIDRLALAGNTIHIADFKTNDPAPGTLAEVPQAYLAQMAIYRGLVKAANPAHVVTAHLVWTATARLMTLPDAVLDAALQQVLSAQGAG